MARYSDDDTVDQAVIGLICGMDSAGPFACPWSERRVRPGTISIADVIARIRFQYGDRAASSIQITVH